jgi:hypothetical protein
MILVGFPVVVFVLVILITVDLMFIKRFKLSKLRKEFNKIKTEKKKKLILYSVLLIISSSLHCVILIFPGSFPAENTIWYEAINGMIILLCIIIELGSLYMIIWFYLRYNKLKREIKKKS